MNGLSHGHPWQRLSWLLLLCLAACSAPPTQQPTQAVTPTTAVSTTTPPAALHAPEIRFALIGNVTDANVWALFDSQGYSYNNYALRSEYWPRLYHLTIPDGQFEPQAASGMPTPIEAEGALFSATVPLRSDLKWTDGSPFGAEDVAFTVNAVLGFKLGFDWQAYYNPEWLDHAAAVDAHTVRFYFKRAVNVSMWQYGALQGPVVQEQYWAPKIKDAEALLPATESATQIRTLQQKVAVLQKQVDALVSEGVTATGEQARQLGLELKRRQGDLSEASNDLSKAQMSIDTAMEAARQALYTLDDTSEPTLGNWMPASHDTGQWVNQANAAHPFGEPHFDRAAYAAYPDEGSAIAALNNGEVNGVLEPNGLSAPDLAGVATGIVTNPSSNADFLVINPSSAKVTEAALRRALFCAIAPSALAGSPASIAPMNSFVLPRNGAWPTISCGNGHDPSSAYDPTRAVDILKSAGYTWTTEPAGQQAGSGLRAPTGQIVPPITLLAPTGKENARSVPAALVVEHYARTVGIPVSVQPVDSSTIHFAVFNDGSYDMAILSWRLSEYPGYLCAWFGQGNPFGYVDDQLRLACQTLDSTSDLELAEAQIFHTQEQLVQELPFIPLYSGLTHDAYRGIRYPFGQIVDGLSGVYGAPSLALPAAP